MKKSEGELNTGAMNELEVGEWKTKVTNHECIKRSDEATVAAKFLFQGWTVSHFHPLLSFLFLKRYNSKFSSHTSHSEYHRGLSSRVRQQQTEGINITCCIYGREQSQITKHLLHWLRVDTATTPPLTRHSDLCDFVQMKQNYNGTRHIGNLDKMWSNRANSAALTSSYFAFKQ